MNLLLLFLLFAIVTGSRGRDNRVWPLLAVSVVVSLGYLGQRFL